MRTKRIPYLTLLIGLVMLLILVIGARHDAQAWQKIKTQYSGILHYLEPSIYHEFLSRKVNLEQSDSQRLETFEALRKETELKALTEFILADREFTAYLENEGSLFLDRTTLAIWRSEREKVAIDYNDLSSTRLALRAYDFTPGMILSQNFTSKLAPLPIFIMLVMLLILALFELKFGAFKQAFYLIIVSSLHSLAYLGLSAEYSAPWQNPLAPSLALGTMLLYHYLKHTRFDKDNFGKGDKTDKKLLVYPATLVVAIILSLILGTLAFSLELVNYTALLLTVMLSLAIMHVSQLIESRDAPETDTQPESHTDWNYRADLAKVQDYLSRFEFDNARQSLNALGNKYPDSSVILEQRYHLAKLQANHEHYWNLARQLIILCVEKQDIERVKRLFTEIQKNASSKEAAQRYLNSEDYHKMMMLFVAHGELGKAEQAFHFLELGASVGIVTEACQVLIDAFKQRQLASKQQQYQMLRERLQA